MVWSVQSLFSKPKAAVISEYTVPDITAAYLTYV